ncbi:MAG: hypothetical protein E6H63_09095 [Betaproteobacteria bacterium]|nr:MAG: hypothetical protein E6H63_09095 [Betaproteobacteria bacterium]
MPLVVYASLYPLEGWHDHGLSPFAYLGSPWPRNVMGLDIALNILGYMPFGFLCVAALHPRMRALGAFAVALAGAAALSLSLEAAQSYLPTRVAANVDVLCNVAGAACGAALAVLAAPAVLGGPLERLRSAAFLDGADTRPATFATGSRPASDARGRRSSSSASRRSSRRPTW